MESGSFVTIGVASPETIRSWSRGEVKNPETINYRTFKPEKGGLFCERIFGPTRDWECACGKYKRQKHKGIVCDKCGVEVCESRVRRERMGHLDLAVPVSHVWFYKCLPSRLSLILDLTPKSLERVLYYESWIVTEPGDTPLQEKQVLTDEQYNENRQTYGDHFKAGMGAEAIQELLGKLNLKELQEQLESDLNSSTSKAIRKKIAKRVRLIEGFLDNNMDPRWMILSVLPVIPPELRPLVPLEGGRFATSDLNDLYRRVINRNNRLRNLLQLHTPEVIIRNEKRMLQEAVDALLDNGRHGRAVTGTGNRPLKSLTDMLKGKQGRFRQNLLGKRVDYSGRSVIVVGPELRINQCGLPKEMALVLFEPFIMSRLKQKGYVHTVRNAKKWIEQKRKEVWDILDEVIKGHPILLNRAPTLHRLSIQAFDPILIEGQAIRLHPLVCTAFNADFDGDQMAVHVPLSNEAQLEAKLIMLSPNNIFSPASGKPITTPSQDITLGVYYLTYEHKKNKKAFLEQEEKEQQWAAKTREINQALEEASKAFASKKLSESNFKAAQEKHDAEMAALNEEIRKCPNRLRWFNDYHELLRAFEAGDLKMHDFVYLHNPYFGKDTVWSSETKNDKYIVTTVGRCIFNEIWPKEMGFFNKQVTKKEMSGLIKQCYEAVGRMGLIKVLDLLKDLGYEYATRAGFSIGIKDMIVPKEKAQFIEAAQKNIDMIRQQRREGMITEQERYNKCIQEWTSVNNELADRLTGVLEENDGKPEINPVFAMLDSGARGSKDQIRQLAGMRGLMAKPSGDIIENPIKANFREGLSVLEYFISSHGARKGLADTALKTADSGYMTRRLVDVAHDVICTEDDCHTANGIYMKSIKEGTKETVKLEDRIIGRFSAEDIYDTVTGNVLVAAGEEITAELAKRIVAMGIDKVLIRSVLTCESERGVCCKCYGRNLATGDLPKHGDPVGIIAAQSIGEPGTQLTMRTFHLGGTAAADANKMSHKARKDGILALQNLMVGDSQQLVPIQVVKTLCSEEKNRSNAGLFYNGPKNNPQSSSDYYNEGFARLIKDEKARDPYLDYCKLNGKPIPAEAALAEQVADNQLIAKGYMVLTQNAHVNVNYTTAEAQANGAASEIDELELPQGSIIYFQDGAIKADFTFAEWDPFNVPINAPISGCIEYRDLVEGSTISSEENSQTAKIEHKVVEHNEDIRPAFDIVDMLPLELAGGNRVKLRFQMQLINTSAKGYTEMMEDRKGGASERVVYRFQQGKGYYQDAASKVGEDEVRVNLDAQGRCSLVLTENDLKSGKIIRIDHLSFESDKVSKGDTLVYDEARKTAVKAPCDGSEVKIDDIRFGKNLIQLSGLKFNETIELDGLQEIDGKRLGTTLTGFFRVKENLRKSVHVGMAIVRRRRNIQLPTGAYFTLEEGELVNAGDELAKFPRQNVRTRDITGGLPRVAELFEARRPKEAAEIAKIDGVVYIDKPVKGKQNIRIEDPESGASQEHVIPQGKRIVVTEGDFVTKGTPLTDGAVVLHEMLEICGPQELQEYLLNEVQQVYRLQGVEINDKHVEIILRQMMRNVRITQPGQTRFLFGELVDKREFQEENKRVLENGGIAADAQPILLGITKASLATESFISAASFQDTTRVLTEAATLGRVDHLRGFKENVIMGHLIPAGTGYPDAQDFKLTFKASTAEEAAAETAALELSEKETQDKQNLDNLQKFFDN